MLGNRYKDQLNEEELLLIQEIQHTDATLSRSKKLTTRQIKTKTTNTNSGVTTRKKQNKIIPYEFDQVDAMFLLLGEMQATCRMTSPELTIIRELYNYSETVEPFFLNLFRFYQHVVTDLA